MYVKRGQPRSGQDNAATGTTKQHDGSPSTAALQEHSTTHQPDPSPGFAKLTAVSMLPAAQDHTIVNYPRINGRPPSDAGTIVEASYEAAA